MGNKPILTVQNTTEKDVELLKAWLVQPRVLDGFPMIDPREVNDAVRIWMDYAKKGASITVSHKKTPCGAANLYVHSVEKFKHQSLFVVVVDQKYRGKGIGTFLLKSLEKLAKEKFNIELLHLEVYEGNPAIGLYEKLGFIYYGRQEKYLKDPDGKYYDKILMQKFLG